MRKRLRVFDLFCGAGGFSEGFRQAGFEIVGGLDKWPPAVKTYNHNFGEGMAEVQDIDAIPPDEIDQRIPDTEVLIGGPPCVHFSNSNRCGRHDRLPEGAALINAFLRIVAVKKHKHRSVLKAWFMENVPNANKGLEDSYTFADLKLSGWANRNGHRSEDEAISLHDKKQKLNAADYGVPQNRLRLVLGELIKQRKTASFRLEKSDTAKTVGDMLDDFPKPNGRKQQRVIDPNYPDIERFTSEISDHFYDTGIHEVFWHEARRLKQEHPYMGKMSFPENRYRPSRTVMATLTAASRESLIYKCEGSRQGNGQYRMPTARERAVLMGYPLHYQFSGTEGVKVKQIGNSICPPLAYVIANAVRKHLGLRKLRKKRFDEELPDILDNLNRRAKRDFNGMMPRKKPGVKFRGHPFKLRNMTVELTNYSLANGATKVLQEPTWAVFATYGTGRGFRVEKLNGHTLRRLDKWMLNERLFPVKCTFRDDVIALIDQIPSSKEWQQIYERNEFRECGLHPRVFIDEVRRIVDRAVSGLNGARPEEPAIFAFKDSVPMEQILSTYLLLSAVKQTRRRK